MKYHVTSNVRISRSAVALAAVCITAIVLIFIFPATQAQNAIQIGAFGALAAILLRGLHKEDAVIDAAVHLAEHLADRARDTGDDDPHDQARLAPVVPLPPQRSKVS